MILAPWILASTLACTAVYTFRTASPYGFSYLLAHTFNAVCARARAPTRTPPRARLHPTRAPTPRARAYAFSVETFGKLIANAPVLETVLRCVGLVDPADWDLVRQ